MKVKSRRRITFMDLKKKTAAKRKKKDKRLIKLKPEHKIVLEAVETANMAFERAVTVSEVIQGLSSKDKTKLETKLEFSSSTLSVHISRLLALLIRRNKVFTAGRIGKRNCYAAVGVLSAEEADVSNIHSRRQKSAHLVRAAVAEEGRALKLNEIYRFAENNALFSHLDKLYIKQDIMSLRQTGDLTAIPIRGDGKGFTLYLPLDFAVEDYLPKQPATWLEFVLKKFNELWNEHKAEAEYADKLPFPIVTGEVRAKIIHSGKFAEKLENPKTLIAAMQQLARTDNPSIRRIKRLRQKAVFWVPREIADNQVNLGQAYAHDTERVEEAVKRASFRLGRPVNTAEIQEEIQNDPSLETVSDKGIYILLSDMSRKLISRGGKTKQKKITIKVHRVGAVSGSAYYYPTKNAEASAYIQFRNLKEKWNSLKPFEEISEIEYCILDPVVIGRLKLLKQQTAEFFKILKKLKKYGYGLGREQIRHREDGQ